MNTNKMKLGLTYIFSENNKISKQAKLQLINFIEQANDTQIKVLAMDGDLISSSKLDEQTAEVINDRFTSLPYIEKSLNKAALLAVNEVIEKRKNK